MSRLENRVKYGLLAILAVVSVVGIIGCSVDSPTAPDQVATDPPTVGADSWKITVNVNPGQIPADSDVPATVNVNVESRTDGSKPPNGTSMTISTSLGDFGAKDSGVQSVGVEIQKGKAEALLFAGDVVAGGTVVARLGGSEDRDTFQVTGTTEMFISSVSPNSGTESGGTHIRIAGVGFAEPLRVFINNSVATVTDVSPNEVRAITPGVPPGSLTTVECGNGGKQYIPLAVDVTVENANGDTDTLNGGFSYTPDNDTCIQ